MIQIEFPERYAPARYTVREGSYHDDDTPCFRTLGSVYHRFKGGYEQEITQNGRVHTIGRSPSLMAAITALRRFHELTGYAYAPWEDAK